MFDGVIVDEGLEEGYLARITGFMRSNREGTGVKGMSLSWDGAPVKGGEGQMGGLVGFMFVFFSKGGSIVESGSSERLWRRNSQHVHAKLPKCMWK